MHAYMICLFFLYVFNHDAFDNHMNMINNNKPPLFIRIIIINWFILFLRIFKKFAKVEMILMRIVRYIAGYFQ